VSIPTFTDGMVPAAAQMNTMPAALDAIAQDTTGAVVAFGRVYRPACRVELTQAQSVANTTNQTITWDMSALSTDGNFQLVAWDHITCNTPGWYRVDAQVAWDVGAASERALQLCVNGTADSNVVASSNTIMNISNNQRQQVTAYLHLALNDNVYARVYQGSGGALNMLPSASASTTSAAWGTWMTYVYEAPY
jgi:hypothetical protein